MLLKTLILVCVLEVVKSDPIRWENIGGSKIFCVGAKGNAFRELVYTGKPAFMAAIKLIHVSGRIICNTRQSLSSNWGCNLNQNDQRMVITDARNKRIYPAPRLVKFGRWSDYELPGFTAMSNELVLSDFGNAHYLATGAKLRIWYSEDLYDNHEHDNVGKTCMKVQAYFL